MEFEDWEPVYEAILADMGYDRVADECARDVLAGLAGDFDLSELPMEGRHVVIAGAAPTLADELALVDRAELTVAASSAATVLQEHGFTIDCLVTDLDGEPNRAVSLSRAGIPVAVHAHGDNIPLLREYVPQFDDANLLATTQAAPVGPVRNFGGFTDGDRAAFLADHLGATRLTFAGWDFDDPAVGADKRAKLRWAERLLYWLERRRNERFAILNGRRNALDESLA